MAQKFFYGFKGELLMEKISFSGKFKDKQMEKAFRDSKWPEKRNLTAMVSIIIIVLVFIADMKNLLLVNIDENLLMVLGFKILVFVTGLIFIISILFENGIKNAGIFSIPFLSACIMHGFGESIIQQKEIFTIDLMVLLSTIYIFYIFLNFNPFLIFFTSASGSFIISYLMLSNLSYTMDTSLYLLSILLITNLTGFAVSIKVASLERNNFSYEKLFNIKHKTSEPDILINNKQLKIIKNEFSNALENHQLLSLSISKLEKLENLNEKIQESILENIKKILEKIFNNTGNYFFNHGSNQFIFLFKGINKKQAIELTKKINSSIEKIIFRYKDEKFKTSLKSGIADNKDNTDLLEMIREAQKELISG